MLAAAAVLAVSGCSMVEPGVSLQDARNLPAGTPTEPASSAVNADKTDSPSPADVMFQSTDGPAAGRASVVNVFGEVDGIAPSPAAGAGSANGLQQHTFLDEGYDADPDVSPDGKWLVFASTRHSETTDIYLKRCDGLAVTQLTADESDDAYPRFSPDGKQIAFASNRAGNWDIYLMDADGGRVRQLTRTAAQEIHPTFSPDGTRLCYSQLGTRSGQWELWTYDLRTTERRMIGYGLFPDWSPRVDRDVIAFQRARQRGTRWFSAWTLDLVDGEARDMTEVAFSGTNAIVAPAWSADGTRLAFCTIADPDSNTPHKTAANDEAADGAAKKPTRTKPPRQDVWTINADGTERARVTDGRGMNAMPCWSRDGRIFFISDRSGVESIWSAAAALSHAPETARASVMTETAEPDDIAPKLDLRPTAIEPTAKHDVEDAGSGHAEAHAE